MENNYVDQNSQPRKLQTFQEASHVVTETKRSTWSLNFLRVFFIIPLRDYKISF